MDLKKRGYLINRKHVISPLSIPISKMLVIVLYVQFLLETLTYILDEGSIKLSKVRS